MGKITIGLMNQSLFIFIKSAFIVVELIMMMDQVQAHNSSGVVLQEIVEANDNTLCWGKIRL